MTNKKSQAIQLGFLLYLSKFVIFEFQSVADIDAEGQQGDGNLGNHAGVVILDKGVVAADIDLGTEHDILLLILFFIEIFDFY